MDHIHEMIQQWIAEETKHLSELEHLVVSEVPEVDLRTLLSEMVSFRAAWRTEAEATKELREQTKAALHLAQQSFEDAQIRAQRAEQKLAALEQANERKQAQPWVEALDRLERAIEQARKMAQPRGWWKPRVDPNAQAMLEGLLLTQTQWLQQLQALHIEPIRSLFQPFDAERMECVGITEQYQYANGLVIEEIACGYTHRQGLWRTSKVIVNRLP